MSAWVVCRSCGVDVADPVSDINVPSGCFVQRCLYLHVQVFLEVCGVKGGGACNRSQRPIGIVKNNFGDWV